MDKETHFSAEKPYISPDIKVLATPIRPPTTFIFDMDGTLYNNHAYREDTAQREINAIADALGWPREEAEKILLEKRLELGKFLGRDVPARLTETVLSLNLSYTWWNNKRKEIDRPDLFLNPDYRVSAAFTTALGNGHNVIVATNSPSEVADRILGILGIDPAIEGKLQIFGSDTLGVSKPNAEFFTRIASAIGVSSEECISVGDDEENDGYAAIEAGMGAIIISNVDDIAKVIDNNLRERAYQSFNPEEFMHSQFKPGEISIVRLTGRAGAGKTTIARKLAEAGISLGIPSAVLGMDAFFKLSSAQRKAWLEEGKSISPEEYAKRANQALWWDFEKASNALDSLRNGHPIHLEGIYNRTDKGELTGELKITPDPRGMVIVFEGVAVAHPPKNGDYIVYVNAHPVKRKERLLGRDQHRAGNAAMERFRLTQSFENGYFLRYKENVDLVIDNSGDQIMRAPAVSLL